MPARKNPRLTKPHVKRIVGMAIRKVCRSKPIEHESFTTIADLHPRQIEHNLLEAVNAVIDAAKGSAS